jgi:Putative transposase, YhgA-like
MTKSAETTEVLDPHDTFFRQLLSEPTVAIDFVQNYLPADVVELLDLAQLRIEKETFVDARLRKHFSDILYSVPLKVSNLPGVTETAERVAAPRKQRKPGKSKSGPLPEERVYLYLLFEHKSQPDKGVRLQHDTHLGERLEAT